MRKGIKAVTLAVLFSLFLLTAVSVHPFGRPPETGMDDYFILNGQEQTGCNNIVTSVVFDYRGIDTLIEAAVLFAAVMGVFMVFGRDVNGW
ncbi:MAG: hypothetical protein JW754_04325 [Candidatus Aenigmarchaeota archaeon]|nr:hypothetical protein [Candidatus Aenigmarchaeota archaeon]